MHIEATNHRVRSHLEMNNFLLGLSLQAYIIANTLIYEALAGYLYIQYS